MFWRHGLADQARNSLVPAWIDQSLAFEPGWKYLHDFRNELIHGVFNADTTKLQASDLDREFLLVFTIAAWHYRWMSDDGFINLRVVSELRAGHGPVFNPGERVEAFIAAVVGGDHVRAIADYYHEAASMRENLQTPRQGRALDGKRSQGT